MTSARQIKFRAWQDNEMLTQPFSGVYAAKRFFGFLYEDTDLMQFTGLKDKNDKEIYEGDIIQYGTFALNDIEKYGAKAWDNLPEGVSADDISTVLSRHKVDFHIPALFYIQQAMENNPDVNGVEVIGNIHENPELMKGVL